MAKEVLATKMGELAKAVNALPESWGAISAVYGPTVEKDDTLGLIIGWTSVDVSPPIRLRRNCLDEH